jgi:hypothetical protein
MAETPQADPPPRLNVDSCTVTLFGPPVPNAARMLTPSGPALSGSFKVRASSITVVDAEPSFWIWMILSPEQGPAAVLGRKLRFRRVKLLVLALFGLK